uniref:Reverse transcriptase domain-containing protein n=1 Tax=Tanacetum cinerariifolium TaxID=118510 RepID=A0A6L2KMJ9_TANCI|nr:reverse transcriptase domain-containing protein [Tanacetum cinerariifolium]
MMAIFLDMIEKTMEVFMDDFSIFRNSFGTCLSHLDKMFKWCEDTNLYLNWEKSHFMVKEGIVLGYKILKNGIEVDKAKVDVIAKLPHPTTVKGVRSFLGHAGNFVVKGMSSQQKNKFFKDVKPLIFLRLAIMDLPGEIMAQTTPPKRCLTPVSISSQSIMMPMTWSNLVTLVNIRKKSRNVMKCLKMPSKFARSLTYEASISWGRSHLHEGTSLELPVLSLVIVHANFELSTTSDHRKVQLNELNELPDQAYKNSLIYKEKTNRIHDSKIKDRVFNVGDRVLLFNSRLKIFSSKLKTRWTRTFTVTQVFPYGTVELSQTDGPNFKVNGHRLKYYFGEDIPPMVVQDL